MKQLSHMGSECPLPSMSPGPVFAEDDSEPMKAAIRFLYKHHSRFRRTTEYQLKIGSVNYYPDAGTIAIDGVKGTQKNLSPSEAEDIIKKHCRTGIF